MISPTSLKQWTIYCASLAAVCCWVADARAAIVVWGGDGQLDNSWIAAAGFSGVAASTVEAFIVSDVGGAGPFETPGMTGFMGNGWTGVSTTPNPSYSYKSGPTTVPATATTWTYHFAGTMPGTIIKIDLIAWSGGILSGSPLASARLTWTGGTFSSITSTPTTDGLTATGGITYDRGVVPEPTSLAIWSLLGLSLTGATWLRRRRAACLGWLANSTAPKSRGGHSSVPAFFIGGGCHELWPRDSGPSRSAQVAAAGSRATVAGFLSTHHRAWGWQPILAVP